MHKASLRELFPTLHHFPTCLIPAVQLSNKRRTDNLTIQRVEQIIQLDLLSEKRVLAADFHYFYYVFINIRKEKVSKLMCTYEEKLLNENALDSTSLSQLISQGKTLERHISFNIKGIWKTTNKEELSRGEVTTQVST